MLADWKIVILRDDITLALAILGASLGVINLFIDLWRNRVSLKVVPKLYASVAAGGSFSWNVSNSEMANAGAVTGEPRLCVEVQNDGHKAVLEDDYSSAKRLGYYPILVNV